MASSSSFAGDAYTHMPAREDRAEAALIHKPVKVELRDGQRFVDHVKTVVTESGQDFVVFQDHARMPVAQIADCEPTSHAPPSDMRRIHETP